MGLEDRIAPKQPWGPAKSTCMPAPPHFSLRPQGGSTVRLHLPRVSVQGCVVFTLYWYLTCNVGTSLREGIQTIQRFHPLQPRLRPLMRTQNTSSQGQKTLDQAVFIFKDHNWSIN